MYKEKIQMGVGNQLISFQPVELERPARFINRDIKSMIGSQLREQDEFPQSKCLEQWFPTFSWSCPTKHL